MRGEIGSQNGAESKRTGALREIGGVTLFCSNLTDDYSNWRMICFDIRNRRGWLRRKARSRLVNRHHEVRSAGNSR